MTEIGAHNSYLQVLIETGVPGLLLFVLFQMALAWRLLGALRYARRAQNRSLTTTTEAAIALFLFVEVLGFMINPYYYYHSEILVWMTIGAALGGYKAKREQQSPSRFQHFGSYSRTTP
jgi:O-antigen ligase